LGGGEIFSKITETYFVYASLARKDFYVSSKNNSCQRPGVIMTGSSKSWHVLWS
jgi:hypothetical protein